MNHCSNVASHQHQAKFQAQYYVRVVVNYFFKKRREKRKKKETTFANLRMRQDECKRIFRWYVLIGLTSVSRAPETVKVALEKERLWVARCNHLRNAVCLDRTARLHDASQKRHLRDPSATAVCRAVQTVVVRVHKRRIACARAR